MSAPFPAGRLRRLVQTMIGSGYAVEHRPTIRVRGWPQASLKPWALYAEGPNGKHLASFRTLEALEANFRARVAA